MRSLLSLSLPHIPVPTSEQVGRAALYLFAFFSFLGVAGANIALFILLVAFAFQWKAVYRTLRREPVALLFLLFAAYVSIGAQLAATEFPATASRQWHAAFNWVELWLFIPVGWFCAGNNRRVTTCLALALTGFLLHVLIEPGGNLLLSVDEHKRYGFGVAVISMGLISGIALLGLITFGRRIVWRRRSWLQRLARLALWGFAVIVTTKVLLISQSRGAWSAALGGMLVLFLFAVLHWKHLPALSRTVLALVVLSGTVGVTVNHDFLAARVSREADTISALVNRAEIEKVPFTSVGRRIHMIHFGLKRWMDRPFLGWGPGTVLTQDLPLKLFNGFERRQAKRLRIHPHLHNSYMDLLARLGLVGALIFGAAGLVVLRALFRAYRRGTMPPETFAFILGALIAMAIWSLASTRLLSFEYRHMVLLFVGIVYGYVVSARSAGEAATMEVQALP